MLAADRKANGINQELLHAAIRFNAMMLGLTGGTMAALIIYFATQASITKWGSDSGNYLGLLAIFFPGYAVTSVGALVGAFWAFVYGALFGSLSYWLYGRVLGIRITEILLNAQDLDNPVLKPSILRLHGATLGLALGSVAGLGLFFSTVWLVLRGTAGESVHAALLSNYIPGYSVSIGGGIWGAIELFIFVFIACLALAVVYNKLVSTRHR